MSGSARKQQAHHRDADEEEHGAEESSSTSQLPIDSHDDATVGHPPHGPIQATADMCHYCFDVLLAHLRSPRTANQVVPKFLRSNPSSAQWHCPLFVTWDKARYATHARPSSRPCPSFFNGSHSSSEQQQQEQQRQEQHEEEAEEQQEQHQFELRGCIGTLAPKPIRTAIGEFAITSAFRDHRFNPIGTHEVPHLRVAVSLLVNYETCRHCHDWLVGVHGIIITFIHGSSEYSATYLPEVAQEQGWNQEEAVVSLIRKAGFHGEVCSNLLDRVHCTRYQSSKQSVTWRDYVSLMGTDPLQTSSGEDSDGGNENQSKGGGSSSNKHSRWRFPFSL